MYNLHASAPEPAPLDSRVWSVRLLHPCLFETLSCFAQFVVVCLFGTLNTRVASGEDDVPAGDGLDAGVSLTGGANDPASPAALVQKADRFVLEAIAVRSSKTFHQYLVGVTSYALAVSYLVPA